MNDFKCPYCGAGHKADKDFENDAHNLMECDSCDKKFVVYVTINYFTYKQDLIK